MSIIGWRVEIAEVCDRCDTSRQRVFRTRAGNTPDQLTLPDGG
jgi:hypothetical protein